MKNTTAAGPTVEPAVLNLRALESRHAAAQAGLLAVIDTRIRPGSRAERLAARRALLTAYGEAWRASEAAYATLQAARAACGVCLSCGGHVRASGLCGRCLVENAEPNPTEFKFWLTDQAGQMVPPLPSGARNTL